MATPYSLIQEAIACVKDEQDKHTSWEYTLTRLKLEEAEIWLLRAQEELRESLK